MGAQPKLAMAQRFKLGFVWSGLSPCIWNSLIPNSAINWLFEGGVQSTEHMLYYLFPYMYCMFSYIHMCYIHRVMCVREETD